MDRLILGLLMLNRFTIYELRNIIKKNFKDMCSDSMGSIQAAMKKLLAAQLVTCSEYVENSVNKKRYSITEQGRNVFMDWLQVPADMTASKNMELGKFLFMGFLPAEKRLPLIDEMIKKMETELSSLLGLLDSIQNQLSNKEQVIEAWKNDPEYLEGVINATQNPDVLQSANGIGEYQMYTLQYGIDSLRFHVDWFKALKKMIVNKESSFPQ